MDWTRDVTEIDGCIARLRADQRAYAQISEDAAEVVNLCRRRIGEDAEEIAQLASERSREDQGTPRRVGPHVHRHPSL